MWTSRIKLGKPQFLMNASKHDKKIKQRSNNSRSIAAVFSIFIRGKILLGWNVDWCHARLQWLTKHSLCSHHRKLLTKEQSRHKNNLKKCACRKLWLYVRFLKHKWAFCQQNTVLCDVKDNQAVNLSTFGNLANTSSVIQRSQLHMPQFYLYDCIRWADSIFHNFDLCFSWATNHQKVSISSRLQEQYSRKISSCIDWLLELDMLAYDFFIRLCSLAYIIYDLFPFSPSQKPMSLPNHFSSSSKTL
jgi:hypothetical protein